MRRLLLLLAPALVAGSLATAVAAGAPASAAGAQGAARCGAWSGGATGHEPLSAAAQRQVAAAKNHADAVFEGQVTLPAHAPAHRALKVHVQVVAVWSGQVSAPSRTTVELRPGPCRDWALAHPSPEDYIFFVDHRAGRWVAAGDAPRVVRHSDGLTAVLGQPQQQGASTPTPVSFQPLDVGAPRSFAKVAAPGAALVIVGLLGLAVVRRLGRRAGH